MYKGNKQKKAEILKRKRVFVFFLTLHHAFIRLKSIKPCDTKLLTVDEDKYLTKSIISF